ncbi:MAG TPA: hypothetical protein VJX23_08060 [Candidatus Binataceae bacterium]|nr:hypothetical protein [Candidatus Binataceae bacterium]
MVMLVPYKLLRERFPILSDRSGSPEVREQLFAIVKLLLASVPVDETWYRKQYPDVGAAIEAGRYESAQRHFIEHGYFEERKPSRLSVDEAWYLAANDDVREGLEEGDIESGEEHFNLYGYNEGRLPTRFPDPTSLLASSG